MKSFWPRFFKKRKRKPKPGMVVHKAPKPHKVEPDRWTPPFGGKKVSPLKVDNQNLTIIHGAQGFDLGQITTTASIMLQSEMDYDFKAFINECLQRYQALDWGGLNEMESSMNDRRIMTRTGTVCGVYTNLRTGIQIWIVTDLDRGITRICFADER